MDVEVRRTYSEVYGILNMMGEFYINKLPKKLYSMIETQRAMDYNPQYDINQGLESQNIGRQSLAMIMLIHLDYWSDEEQKSEIKRILKKNEEEIEEKYSIDKIFERKKESVQEIEKTESVELVEYKETVIQKIRKFIYGIFHRK